MLFETHFIFMLFETNFVFMLFALMLFGNSPLLNEIQISLEKITEKTLFIVISLTSTETSIQIQANRTNFSKWFERLSKVKCHNFQ